MKIQAGQYTLRSFQDSDVIPFYNIAHDDIVKKYVSYAYPEDYENANEMVQDYVLGDCKNDFYLLIEKDSNVIGAIIAVRIVDKILDVSAFLGKDYRQKGIMTIAMTSFKKWLKQYTSYRELRMHINKDNDVSNCQVKKIGGIKLREKENAFLYKVQL